MHARDVMTRNVVTVSPETSVPAIAALLLDRRISAVPVVDDSGRVIGIVSEGDLIHRPEADTEAAPSRWQSLFESREEAASRFVKTHGGHARDVMTRHVVTATEDTALSDIAMLLDRRHIKRVPIVRAGRLVGIVSRADLLRGLLTARQPAPPAANISGLRDAVIAAVRKIGIRDEFINVVAAGRVVHLWGSMESAQEKRALRVAAEQTPGVEKVIDHTQVMTSAMRAMVWE